MFFYKISRKIDDIPFDTCLVQSYLPYSCHRFKYSHSLHATIRTSRVVLSATLIHFEDDGDVTMIEQF